MIAIIRKMIAKGIPNITVKGTLSKPKVRASTMYKLFGLFDISSQKTHKMKNRSRIRNNPTDVSQ